jgi:RNA polymerase sigma-70 factor (TIGR02960 family)
MAPKTSTRTGSDAEEGRLLAAARDGDQAAFERLVATYRRQLHAHCYRMLGSLQDAEDALQETLLSAWRGLGGFEGRSAFRTWLYRIATNACLRLAQRRPRRVLSSDQGPAWTDFHDLGDVRENDPMWLEPYPSSPSGAGLADGDPADRYQRRENVELAFVAALQRLPANQRAVLILREVLEFSAAEVAQALDTTVASVNSALQRARKAVDHRIVEGTQAGELQALGERGQHDLVAAFVAAWDRADVDALLDLLAEDAHFTMPPLPAWFRGKSDIGRFLSERVFEIPRRARPVVASGQLAMVCYGRDRDSHRFVLDALNVLTVRGGQIAAMNAFLDPATLRWFDLPEEWVDETAAGGTDEKSAAER